MNGDNKLGLLIILSSLIGAGFPAIPAFADVQGPCAADIQKFCANVQPGGGAIAQCLKAHQADLSDACKQRGEELKQKFQSFAAACQEDSEKFCKDVEPGHGQKIKCLKDNMANLSPACQEQVSHIRGGVQIRPSGTPPPTQAAPGNNNN